ncbi:RsmE family RNA methyltransferase [Rhodopirellula sp. SWK7]|uniref:RsmE family RNA methyltransferase n=1 Tax=Rhodopirellula sp. SWK7 TaxID=595460 RepID=UPI0002BDC177|nr:RsmE family RNA methyltransferase [Rhodopirellula sp. SWK7]EMI43044.1 Ribosomal RNA small subunit methyltransferase E [Rhodopirellula sp. SWK7]
MTRRYYTPDLMIQQPMVELPDEEAMHAARVMRVRVDDEIELFDGKGNQAAARVTSVDRRQCVCQCETPAFVDREPTVELELAIGLPKPDRAKEMIERLTELGVTRIQPLVFERTQRPPADAFLDKLDRIVIEACKQSGRNRLMSIAPVMRFTKWISLPPNAQSSQPANSTADHMAESTDQDSFNPDRRLVAMPGGGTMNEIVAEFAAQTQFRSLQCTIGPEGGLTDDELSACQDVGMVAVDLGKRILRVETAACVIAACFLRD